jgi:predicted RNase H-like HicB family nuclease
MKKEFLVVFEIGKTSFGAFAPDIPGCFAVGPTLDETRRRFLEAVEAHLEWMANDHDPIPQPVTTVFDFSREPGEETSSYFVEWLAIPLPVEMRLAISA